MRSRGGRRQATCAPRVHQFDHGANHYAVHFAGQLRAAHRRLLLQSGTVQHDLLGLLRRPACCRSNARALTSRQHRGVLIHKFSNALLLVFNSGNVVVTNNSLAKLLESTSTPGRANKLEINEGPALNARYRRPLDVATIR